MGLGLLGRRRRRFRLRLRLRLRIHIGTMSKEERFLRKRTASWEVKPTE